MLQDPLDPSVNDTLRQIMHESGSIDEHGYATNPYAAHEHYSGVRLGTNLSLGGFSTSMSQPMSPICGTPHTNISSLDFGCNGGIPTPQQQFQPGQTQRSGGDPAKYRCVYVYFPTTAIGSIMGRGGEHIKELRNTYACRVIADKEGALKGCRLVRIEGDRCLDALQQIVHQIAQDVESTKKQPTNSGVDISQMLATMELVYQIPKKLASNLIGKAGSTINELREKCRDAGVSLSIQDVKFLPEPSVTSPEDVKRMYISGSPHEIFSVMPVVHNAYQHSSYWTGQSVNKAEFGVPLLHDRDAPRRGFSPPGLEPQFTGGAQRASFSSSSNTNNFYGNCPTFERSVGCSTGVSSSPLQHPAGAPTQGRRSATYFGSAGAGSSGAATGGTVVPGRRSATYFGSEGGYLGGFGQHSSQVNNSHQFTGMNLLDNYGGGFLNHSMSVGNLSTLSGLTPRDGGATDRSLNTSGLDLSFCGTSAGLSGNSNSAGVVGSTQIQLSGVVLGSRPHTHASMDTLPIGVKHCETILQIEDRTVGKIIGPKGSTVMVVRRDTGCSIWADPVEGSGPRERRGDPLSLRTLHVQGSPSQVAAALLAIERICNLPGLPEQEARSNAASSVKYSARSSVGRERAESVRGASIDRRRESVERPSQPSTPAHHCQ